MLKKMAFIGLLGLGAQTATAGDLLIGLCDYCTSSGFTSTALATVTVSGSVYVIDRPKHVVKRFEVLRDREPGLEIVEAREAPPIKAEMDDINAALDAYYAFISANDVAIGDLPLPPVPPTNPVPDSAFDIIGSPFNNQLIANAVSDWAHSSFTAALLHQATATAAFEVIIKDIKHGVVVKSPDGSKYTYKLQSTLEMLDQFTVLFVFQGLKNSGVDGQGLPIPETAAGFAGRTFTGGSESSGYAQNARDAAGRLGVPIIVVGNGGTGGGGGSVLSIVCWREDGGVKCDVKLF